MDELSGLVAILTEDMSAVAEVRDLGANPVPVKPGRVLPLADSYPALQEGDSYGTSSFVIGGQAVTRIWSVVSPSLAEAKAEKLKAAAAKRWAVETAGIIVGGFPIYTDDRSKLMITGARIKADNDPSFTTKWVAADGSRTTVDAATIIAISDAVLGHVDACFDRFDVLATAIAGATSKANLAAIDVNSDWPPNI